MRKHFEIERSRKGSSVEHTIDAHSVKHHAIVCQVLFEPTHRTRLARLSSYASMSFPEPGSLFHFWKPRQRNLAHGAIIPNQFNRCNCQSHWKSIKYQSTEEYFVNNFTKARLNIFDEISKFFDSFVHLKFSISESQVQRRESRIEQYES